MAQKPCYYKSEQRKKVLGLNFLGNTSQLVTTLFFGTFGLTYLIKNHGYTLKLTNTQIIGILALLVVILFFSLWLFKRKKQHLKFGVFNRKLI